MLVSFYQDMRAEAEQQVYDRLNMKIEEFIELGAYKYKLLKLERMYLLYIALLPLQ